MENFKSKKSDQKGILLCLDKVEIIASVEFLQHDSYPPFRNDPLSRDLSGDSRQVVCSLDGRLRQLLDGKGPRL